MVKAAFTIILEENGDIHVLGLEGTKEDAEELLARVLASLREGRKPQ